MAAVRLKIIHRVWGTDTEFLAREGDLYRRVLASRHLVRARGFFIARDRNREARQKLELADGGPVGYRALTVPPGPLVRGLVSVRRAIRGERT